MTHEKGEMQETRTLADALPEEIARVRDKVIPVYEKIGIAGAFALAMMRQSIANAERATAAQDTLAMLRAYEDLKGYEL